MFFFLFASFGPHLMFFYFIYHGCVAFMLMYGDWLELEWDYIKIYKTVPDANEQKLKRKKNIQIKWEQCTL